MKLLANMRKLLYYYTGVDRNGLTNRYFHMPLLRTLVLGVQLYQEKVKGDFDFSGRYDFVSFLKKAQEHGS